MSVVASSTGTSASVQAGAVDSVLNVGTQEKATPTESLSQKVSGTTASRKRSWVWEHFEEYTHKEVVKVKGQEDVVKESKRAKCKYCPKGAVGDYAVDSYRNGTHGMLRHLNHSCKYYPGNRKVDKNQKVMAGDKTKGNRLKMIAFKPEEVMNACVEMIVVD